MATQNAAHWDMNSTYDVVWARTAMPTLMSCLGDMRRVPSWCLEWFCLMSWHMWPCKSLWRLLCTGGWVIVSRHCSICTYLGIRYHCWCLLQLICLLLKPALRDLCDHKGLVQYFSLPQWVEVVCLGWGHAEFMCSLLPHHEVWQKVLFPHPKTG